MIRILVVDDHPAMRQGICQILTDCKLSVDVIGTACDGIVCLELAEKHNPDLVFLDINMPKMNGLDVIGLLPNKLPEVRIICLTMYSSRYLVRQALDAGAMGFILKEDTVDTIISAVQTVMNKNIHFLSPDLDPEIINEYRRGMDTMQSPVNLTPREKEILVLVARGGSSKIISQELEISVRTVENHRQNIMEKLDCHTTAEITRYALEAGYLREGEKHDPI